MQGTKAMVGQRQKAFRDMHNVAIGPDGSYHISDHANHVIRRVDRAGNISTYAGGKGISGDEKSVACQIQHAYQCIISPDKKYLLVADIKNYRIRRVTLHDDKLKPLQVTANVGSHWTEQRQPR